MKKWKFPIFALCIVAVAIALMCWLFNSGDEETSSDSENMGQVLAGVNPDASESLLYLSGTVKNARSGKPLSARVTLKTQSKSETINTNDMGEYRILMPSDSCDVSVSSDGYVVRGRNDETFQISANAEGNTVKDFELWPQAKATGRIVNHRNGVSANIVVSYHKDFSGAQDYEFAKIDTDDNGEFTLDQAYAGSLSFAITAEGFPTLNLDDVILDFGETTDLGDIPLDPGTSIYGVVTDASTGNPIHHASIVVSDDNDQVIAQIASSEDGTYRLPALIMTKATISITADGYHERRSSVNVGAKENYEYNASLSKVAGILVNINNNTGREPVLSTLTVTDLESNKVIHQHEYENGSYQFADMTEGPYLFTLVSHDKKAKAEQRATGGNTVSLTLKPFARLNVLVTIKESLKNKNPNAPLAGTYRYKYTDLNGVETTTDWFDFTEDSFYIEDLLPGTYVVDALTAKHVFDEEHVSSSAPVVLSDGETRFVKLKLTSGGTIRGRIQFPDGMQNRPGSVHMMKRDGNEGYWHTEVAYDINGDFVFDELPYGNIHLSVQTDDGLVLAYPNLNVQENDDILMDFNMKRARQTGDNGQSLKVPLPNWEEIRNSNTPFRMQSWLENEFEPWVKALGEQQDYQNNMTAGDNPGTEME